MHRAGDFSRSDGPSGHFTRQRLGTCHQRAGEALTEIARPAVGGELGCFPMRLPVEQAQILDLRI